VDQGAWDYDTVYKLFAIHHDGRWLLWYNGRRQRVEQIGLALFEGDECAGYVTPKLTPWFMPHSGR
jgi:hypothetical protein